MSKIYCASIECRHNKKNVCKAKEINLSDEHIHTKYQGFKHFHFCKTYEMSKEAVEFEEAIKAWNTRTEKEVGGSEKKP